MGAFQGILPPRALFGRKNTKIRVRFHLGIETDAELV